MARAGRRQSFWLIVGSEDGHLGLFVMDRGEGRRTLPVFSYQEEAEIFLRLGSLGPGWWVRQSAAGEITSLLYTLCADVGQVALDPLPEICGEELVDLVSLDRGRFARSLTGEPGALFLSRGNGHGQAREVAVWREPSVDGAAWHEHRASADGDGSRDGFRDGSGQRSLEDVEIPDYVMRDFGSSEEARDGSDAARHASGVRDAGEDLR